MQLAALDKQDFTKWRESLHTAVTQAIEISAEQDSEPPKEYITPSEEEKKRL